MSTVLDWIGKAYKWFWQDFLCRTEPFTFEFRRMAKKWPVIWVIFPALIIVVYFMLVIYRAKKSMWAWVLLGFILTAFITWLLLHLGGFT